MNFWINIVSVLLEIYFKVFVGIYVRFSWSKNKDACKLAPSNYNFTMPNRQIVKSNLGDLEQHKWVKSYILIWNQSMLITMPTMLVWFLLFGTFPQSNTFSRLWKSIFIQADVSLKACQLSSQDKNKLK